MAWTKAKIGDYEVGAEALEKCRYSVDASVIALTSYLKNLNLFSKGFPHGIVISQPYIMVEVFESCGVNYHIFNLWGLDTHGPEDKLSLLDINPAELPIGWRMWNFGFHSDGQKYRYYSHKVASKFVNY